MLTFQTGDFVEYDSTCSKAVFRGVLTHIGWLGGAPKQPRHVAFVDDRTGRASLMVSVDRLRQSQGFATWLNTRNAA
jgi:hypothetical protein